MTTSETTHASSGADRTPIVGAGPAGLAVAACLARAGIPCLVLEQGDGVGASWRSHYDRLHLNTNKGLSALPFARFPRHYPRYPSRRQMIAYLEEYARRFAIEPKFGAEVVAAGCTREPNRPRRPGQESYTGPVLHSSGYRSGAPFAGRRVLVVGLGNSGGEDAVILATGYRPRVDSFLQGGPTALDRHGAPGASGPRSAVPGLFFCGYRIVPTGILREVGREARLIAAAIARERSAAGGR